jgi:bifunctional non-homologous end joining protein LigD
VWVFDILSLRGQDLRPLPFATRRYKLGSCGSPLIQYSEFFSHPHALLVAFKLEGIVSKRLDRQYRSGRTTD